MMVETRCEAAMNGDPLATLRQLEANRQNALCSTGPRTSAGKAVSALNAVTHGILSARTVIPGEDQEEFASFATALLIDLAPVGALETLLADQVIASAWRLRRLLGVDAVVHLAAREGCLDGGVLGIVTDLAPKLGRYGATIERSLYRALHELQRLQAAREGQSVPAPAVVEVDVEVRRYR